MDNEANIDSGLAQPGATHYMNAPALQRGLHMPSRVKLFIALLGLAGLIVAAIFGFRAYDTIANAPSRYAESINEAIHTGPGLELPVLNNFVGTDTATMRTSFSDSKYSIIDVHEMYDDAEEADEFTLDVVKVPSDMDRKLSEELFKKSLRRTGVVEAAHFLSGSWRFTAAMAEGTDIKVKYAEFDSATIEEAITKAIAAQGWSDSTFGEAGEDQSGNTFQSGTITINDQNFNWTVSACPLDEVYSVSGLPENSFYIGARLVS